jgi:hypothetical protein
MEVMPWLRPRKPHRRKSLEEEALEAHITLPPFPPPPLPPPPDPFDSECSLVYGEPLPPDFDDRYALSLSSHVLIFRREAPPPPIAFSSDGMCSGFLSDGIAPQSDTDVPDDDSEVPKPLVDDSAAESHDEPQNPSSAQSQITSNPSQSSTAHILSRRSHAKFVKLGEESSMSPALSKRSSEASLPEPLKGKTCVVISTQGSYQPLYHEFENPTLIPKIHLFYFEEYTQSPYDTPAVNVDRYLAEKKQLRERKRMKDPAQVAKMAMFCEICKSKIKGTFEEHRTSERHQRSVAHLDWTVLDSLSVELGQETGEMDE